MLAPFEFLLILGGCAIGAMLILFLTDRRK